MATTAAEVIDQAVEMSSLNKEDLINETQSLAYISNFQKRAYLIAAQENPDFFGKEGTTAVRGDATSSWDLTSQPGDVAAVSEVEVAALNGTPTGISLGDPVSVITRRQPSVALGMRVYIRGQTIHEYDETLQEDSSNYVSQLTVYYSEMPASITADTDNLSLPEEWEDLVVVPLARQFALSDGRPDEAQLLDQDYSGLIQLFRQHLSVYDEAAIRGANSVRAASITAMSPRADG